MAKKKSPDVPPVADVTKTQQVSAAESEHTKPAPVLTVAVVADSDNTVHAPVSDATVLTPTHIIIQGPAGGFRRCGYRFDNTPQCLAMDVFSDAQLERLLSETCLKVAFKTEA